jgi:membrane-bound lytic murein transglycosylase D
MSIRARFLLTVLSCLGLLASGVFTPGTAQSYLQGPALLGFAAVPSPPEPEEPIRRGPTVEPRIDPPGSEVYSPRPDEIPDVDPWAEAFAESARLQVRELPEYPVTLNAQVQYFLDRFTGTHRPIVETWMSRSGRYIEMIRETLRGRGLPTDLAFTVMIESGFNPQAVSRVGAKGLWQFMAKTARGYGLRVDQWVDERFDPEKSTVAAAAYLRDLYSQFGSWPLAQAAYNAGEVPVARAVRVTGSSDFWVINRTRYLRRETKEFVPAIQAATIIGRNPEQYGFETGEASSTDHERVNVPPATDLRRLAAATGVPLEALRSLNPVLVRGVTPPRTTWDLRVPTGTRDEIVAALARRPTVHVVKSNETVGSIAKQHGVSVGDLLRWNSLQKQGLIHPGDRLRVADLR